jgi:branched-chain amino acid aminotransferase
MCLIDTPYTRDQLISACVETLRANGLRGAYLRPLVFLGDGAMGLGATEMPVRVAIATYVWGTYLGEEGVRRGIRAKVSSFARASLQSSLLKAKVCGQYVNSVLAKREVVKGGYDEAILLDSTGQVAEASGENIFAVIRGRLLTPPLSAAILDGITRDSVLALARDLGIPADERPLSRDQLYMADEVFLTGTAAEITPVREIDDRRIGTGQPGPITQKLQTTFHQAVRGQLAPYGHWITPV